MIGASASVPGTDAPNKEGVPPAPSEREPIIPPPPPSYSAVPPVLQPPRPRSAMPKLPSSPAQDIPSGPDRPSLPPTVEVSGGSDADDEGAWSVGDDELLVSEDDAPTDAPPPSEDTEEPPEIIVEGSGRKPIPSSFPAADPVSQTGMFDNIPDHRDRASQHVTGVSGMSQLERDDALQRIQRATSLTFTDAHLQPLGVLKNAKAVLVDEKWLENEEDMRSVILLTLRALEPETYAAPKTQENLRTGDFTSLAHVFLRTLGDRRLFGLKRSLERRKQALDKKKVRGG